MRQYEHNYLKDKNKGDNMIDPPSVFIQMFGDTPFLRILDHFLLFDGFEYSKSWLAKEYNISRMTMDKIWKQLIAQNIIIKTRNVGRAEMYKTNMNNQLVRALINFDLKISSMAAREEFRELNKNISTVVQCKV